MTLSQGTDMTQPISLNSQNKYEIKVYGQVDGSKLDLLTKAKVHIETLSNGSNTTTFSDIVMDQAGLVGLIRRLHGLGIVLLSIRQLELTPPD
jgi:hypothetical protein